MFIRRKILIILFGILFTTMLNAQAYLRDLQNGDIEAVEKKLVLLDTGFDTEPILALYLESSNAESEIVEKLIKKGTSITLVSPRSELQPLYIAVRNRQSTEVIKVLLQNGSAIDIPFTGSWGNGIIEYTLADRQYQSASCLLKHNEALPIDSRQVTDEKYESFITILTDKTDQAKKIIAAGDFQEKEIWKLAINGNSRNILKILLDLYDEPDIDNEDLKLIVENPDLLNYFVSIGFVFSEKQLKTSNLYEHILENKDLLSLGIIRTMDLKTRPNIYQQAMDTGLEYFKVVTRDFNDLTRQNLYKDGYIVDIVNKSDFTSIEPLLNRYKPSGLDLLKIYQDNSDLFITIVNNDPDHSLSINDVDSYTRQRIWNNALEKNDIEGMMTLVTLDSDVPSNFINSVLKQNTYLFIQLIDQGLKIGNIDKVWDTALVINNSDVFTKLLSIKHPPGDITKRILKYGDDVFLRLLQSGYKITAAEIQWEELIKRSYKQTIYFLVKESFIIPVDSLLTALAHDEDLFLSLIKRDMAITRELIGTKTIKIGSRNPTSRLIIDVAIEKGFFMAIKKLDEYYKIFNVDMRSQDPDVYPWDYWAEGGQPRGRKLLKYYDVIRKGDERGYGPDGYNDFLTNNFNTLMFLIAFKNDQYEVAEYIVGRDRLVINSSLFSNNESSGDGQFKYLIKTFVRRNYSGSSCIRLFN